MNEDALERDMPLGCSRETERLLLLMGFPKELFDWFWRTDLKLADDVPRFISSAYFFWKKFLKPGESKSSDPFCCCSSITFSFNFEFLKLGISISELFIYELFSKTPCNEFYYFWFLKISANLYFTRLGFVNCIFILPSYFTASLYTLMKCSISYFYERVF